MTRPLLWLVPVRALLALLAVGMSVADRLPWWFAVLVVVREVASGAIIVLRRLRTDDPIQPDPLAPPAAALLLVGLVLIALASGDGSAAVLARVFGWAAAWWGLGLSWATVVGHVRDLQRLLAPRADRVGRA